MKEMETRKCPRCGKEYRGVPALSRQDNKPLICSDCGTRESLESLGVGKEEQNKIIGIIHENYIADWLKKAKLFQGYLVHLLSQICLIKRQLDGNMYLPWKRKIEKECLKDENKILHSLLFRWDKKSS